jgi:AcrR family transcriptional regulator
VAREITFIVADTSNRSNRMADNLLALPPCSSPSGLLKATMPARPDSFDASAVGLHVSDRLPAGRHRIPAQEVYNHQHQRLLGAMAALCAERGYSHVVISDVVARAGVSKTAFYRFFETKDDCLFSAHKYFSASLLAAIDASCSEDEDISVRLRQAIGSALQFCASNPESAQLLTLGILSCGPIGIERYEVLVEALANRLRALGDLDGGQNGNAAIAAVVFAGPLMTRSIGEDPDAILSLESDLLEVILAFFSMPRG